ncbi:MAG: hypothetical protein HY270_21915 [Deltaproteobacteria bacterium]|nr:hypothetical protein [Deltaproteobacteria bacterium]
MRRLGGLIGLGLCAFGIAGCAVLTIDVDVYKGALSNDRKLQIQQLAVMATAAKPLLVQLRNQLESPRDPEEVRNRANYRDEALGDSFFTDRHARVVDEILGLYDDRRPVNVPPSLFDDYKRLKENIDHYEHASQTLDDRNDPKEIWESLKRKVSSEEGAGRLASAYEDFLISTDDKFRRKDAIFQSVPRILEQTRRDIEESLEHESPTLSAPSRERVSECVKKVRAIPSKSSPSGKHAPDFTDCVGSNFMYKQLADQRVVGDHARLLFVDSDDRRRFVSLITGIARAFADARGAEEEILERTLRMVAQISSVPELTKWQQTNLTEGAAGLAVKLMQMEYLRVALAEEQDQKEGSRLAAGLKDDRRLAGFNFDRTTDFRKERSPVEWALRDMLVKCPQKAGELLALHYNFKRKNIDRVDENLFESFKLRTMLSVSTSRMYGLTRGPYDFSGADVAAAFNRLNFGGGLTEGRLDDGLNTLIENYLVASSQAKISCDKESDEKSCVAEHKLLEALVQFSEKILVLVNNDILLRQKPQEAEGWIPWSEREVQETLWRGKDPSSQVYTRLLQAVGNSIQVLANELQRDRDHDARIGKSAGNEIEAIKLSSQVSPAAFINQILASIQSPDDQLLERHPKVVQQRTAEGKRKTDIRSANDKLSGFKRVLNGAQETKVKAEKEKTAWTLVSQNTAAIDTVFNDGSLKGSEIIEKLGVEIGLSLEDDSWKPIESELKRSLAKQLDQSFSKTTFNKRVEAELARLNKEIETATEGITLATQHIQEAEGEVKALPSIEGKRTPIGEKAVTVIREVRGSVENALPAMSSRQSIIIALRDAVKKKDAEAAEVLDQLPLPTTPSPPQKGQSAIEVIDALVAQLEHDYIQTVAVLGKESPKAKNLDQAIQAAYGRRAGRIGLRPASAFLRSSFKTTALQQDASLGDTNMLLQHAVKQLPFASYFTHRGVDYDTLQEIDKQFWQSVNRVRVAGAGRTNYVVAKDDVGNWYVKNVSADPQDIIKGAQGLALFAAGPGLGANLLAMRPKEGSEQPSDGGGQKLQSVTEQQVAKFQSEYTTKTLADRDQLKADLGSIKGRALDSMIGDANAKTLKDGLTAALDAAAGKAIKTDVFTKETAETTVRKEILQGLRQISSFYKQSVVEIADRVPLSDKKSARDTSKTALDKATNDAGDAGTALDAAEAELKLANDALANLAADSPGIAEAKSVVAAAKTKRDKAKQANDDKKKALDSAQNAFDTADKALTTADAGLKYARRTLAETLAAELRKWVERRSQTVAHFQSAMEILGDLGAPEASK